MIELTLLALLHRLMNWGLAPLIATRTVAADAATLHRFLAEPANQLRLVGRSRGGIEARVRSRASGRVVSVELARGERTLLWLTWLLSAGRGTSEVDLVVQFEMRGLSSRLALVLGGRRWLAHRMETTLASLAQICARAAEDVAPALAPTHCTGRSRKPRPARDARRPRLVRPR